jgi:ribosome biogenesis GTPase A
LIVWPSVTYSQIVDARSPLLFRSPDLENWTLGFGNKQTLLLVNKADLLNEKQRTYWAEYFNKEAIPFVFFSARAESEKNQQRRDEESEEQESKTPDILEDEDDDSEDEVEEGKEKKEQVEAKTKQEVAPQNEAKEEGNENGEDQGSKEEKLKKRKREDVRSISLNSPQLVGADDLLELITEKCTETVVRGTQFPDFLWSRAICFI